MNITKGSKAGFALIIILSLIFSPGCSKNEQKTGESGVALSSSEKNTLTPEQYAKLDDDLKKIQNKKIKGQRDWGLGGVIEFEYDLK